MQSGRDGNRFTNILELDQDGLIRLTRGTAMITVFFFFFYLLIPLNSSMSKTDERFEAILRHKLQVTTGYSTAYTLRTSCNLHCSMPPVFSSLTRSQFGSRFRSTIGFYSYEYVKAIIPLCKCRIDWVVLVCFLAAVLDASQFFIVAKLRPS